jgi:hypothetical protein
VLKSKSHHLINYVVKKLLISNNLADLNALKNQNLNCQIDVWKFKKLPMLKCIHVVLA